MVAIHLSPVHCLTTSHEPLHPMRGLAARPRAELLALDMSRLRLETEPTLSGSAHVPTYGYAASP
jgi:hypothetical protein